MGPPPLNQDSSLFLKPPSLYVNARTISSLQVIYRRSSFVHIALFTPPCLLLMACLESGPRPRRAISPKQGRKRRTCTQIRVLGAFRRDFWAGFSGRSLPTAALLSPFLRQACSKAETNNYSIQTYPMLPIFQLAALVLGLHVQTLELLPPPANLGRLDRKTPPLTAAGGGSVCIVVANSAASTAVGNGGRTSKQHRLLRMWKHKHNIHTYTSGSAEYGFPFVQGSVAGVQPASEGVTLTCWGTVNNTSAPPQPSHA